MNLEKLSSENLGLALNVAEEIFPYEVKNGRLSLQEAYEEAIEKQWPHFAYYLASDGGDVIGITGHYPPEDDSKEIWLGWFGIRPRFRGKGYGSQLLDATAKIVSGFGVAEMHIYSGDRDEERRAHALYARHGFMPTGSGEVAGESVLFFKGPVPPNTNPEEGDDSILPPAEGGAIKARK